MQMNAKQYVNEQHPGFPKEQAYNPDINSHLTKACYVFKRTTFKGFLFSFWNNGYFLLNSKFMILDKQPMGHNAIIPIDC